MTPDTGPQAGKEGLVEDLKGKAKDVIGQVTGKEDLERESEAQQERAAADREVAQKEAEAERARAEATKHEAEERTHQDWELRSAFLIWRFRLGPASTWRRRPLSPLA